MEAQEIKDMLDGMIAPIAEAVVELLAETGKQTDLEEITDDLVKEAQDEMEDDYKAENPDDDELKGMDEEYAEKWLDGKAQSLITSVVLKREKRARKMRQDARLAVGSVLESLEKHPYNSAKDSVGKAVKTNQPPLAQRGTGNISVGESRKYAHLTAQDMAIGYLRMQAAVPAGMRHLPNAVNLTSDYVTHMVHKAAREMEKTGFADIRDEVAVKSAMPFKADEINATDIAGQGQEWVGVFYGTRLWERARNDIALMRMMLERGMFEQEIPEGHGSVDVPAEGSDPIAYSTPQANDLDATGRPEVTANIGFFGTPNVIMTPGQIKIAAATTDELVEDSIIPILPNMSRQINLAALETIERALINGDRTTTVNTNINLIDGTPGTGINRPYYLAVDGLRKYPLVTNAAFSNFK